MLRIKVTVLDTDNKEIHARNSDGSLIIGPHILLMRKSVSAHSYCWAVIRSVRLFDQSFSLIKLSNEKNPYLRCLDFLDFMVL